MLGQMRFGSQSVFQFIQKVLTSGERWRPVKFLQSNSEKPFLNGSYGFWKSPPSCPNRSCCSTIAKNITVCCSSETDLNWKRTDTDQKYTKLNKQECPHTFCDT